MAESKSEHKQEFSKNLGCPLHGVALTLDGQWCLVCDQQYHCRCWWCDKQLSGGGQFCSLDCTTLFEREQKIVQERQNHQVLVGRQDHRYGKCICPFKMKGGDSYTHLGNCPACITTGQQGQIETYTELMREVKQRKWEDVVYDYSKCDIHKTAFRPNYSCDFCDPEVESRRKHVQDLYAEYYRAKAIDDQTLAKKLAKKIRPFRWTAV